MTGPDTVKRAEPTPTIFPSLRASIAEETMELDEKTFGEIMREEAERIKSEQDEPKNG